MHHRRAATTLTLTDTCKAVAEDEILFGSNQRTDPVDVTACLSHAIEQLPNGFPHITSQLDEACVTFCKKPGGEPSYPDEVDGGTFHF